MNRVFENLAGVHLPCHRNPPPSCDPKLIQSIGGEIVSSGHTCDKTAGCALFATKHGHSLRNRVLPKDKAGVPACDINAMARECPAERKANICELGYRGVELVQYVGPALAEH
jgi:hypothetical protein